MKCFSKLCHLFVMLCYIYCSLATAYAETMRGQLSKNAVHLNSHKDAFCVLASFRVLSSKEALLDWSPREHKSVLLRNSHSVILLWCPAGVPSLANRLGLLCLM